ncbi:MAG: hypothetical protein RL711_1851, partial [Bacteroidota bacterium]
ARYLAQNKVDIFVVNPLKLFLETNIKASDFKVNENYLKAFISLDDYDVFSAIKQWMHHPDFVLSFLSTHLIERKLFKVKVQNKPFDKTFIKEIGDKIKSKYNIDQKSLQYILLQGTISNEAYISQGLNINIVNKKGEVLDIADAADLPNITAISKKVKKHYLCWPKSINL